MSGSGSKPSADKNTELNRDVRGGNLEGVQKITLLVKDMNSLDKLCTELFTQTDTKGILHITKDQITEISTPIGSILTQQILPALSELQNVECLDLTEAQTCFNNIRKHIQTLEEKIKQSQTLEEKIKHIQALEENIKRIQTLEENIKLIQTLVENIKHIQALIKQSQTLEEKIKHIQALEENIKHIQPLEENIKQFQTLEEKIKHIQTLEEKIKHIQTLEEEEKIKHIQALEEKIKLIQPLVEKIKQFQTLEENIKQFQTLEENIKQFQTLEENIEQSQTLEEKIKHIRTLEENIKQSEDSPQPTDNKDLIEKLKLQQLQLDQLHNYMHKAVHYFECIKLPEDKREIGKILNLFTYDILHSLLQPEIDNEGTYKKLYEQAQIVNQAIETTAKLLSSPVTTNIELINTALEILRVIEDCREILYTALPILSIQPSLIPEMMSIMDQLQEKFNQEISLKLFRMEPPFDIEKLLEQNKKLCAQLESQENIRLYNELVKSLERNHNLLVNKEAARFIYSSDDSVLCDGYDVDLMSKLPENGIPQKYKIYVGRQDEKTLTYVVRDHSGRKVEGTLDIATKFEELPMYQLYAKKLQILKTLEGVIYGHDDSVLREVYGVDLMSNLPENGIPQKYKIYVGRQDEKTLTYVVRDHSGRKVEGTLDIATEALTIYQLYENKPQILKTLAQKKQALEANGGYFDLFQSLQSLKSLMENIASLKKELYSTPQSGKISNAERIQCLLKSVLLDNIKQVKEGIKQLKIPRIDDEIILKLSGLLTIKEYLYINSQESAFPLSKNLKTILPEVIKELLEVIKGLHEIIEELNKKISLSPELEEKYKKLYRVQQLLTGQNITVKLAKKEGADVSPQSKDGETALMIAAREGDLEGVNALLQKEGVDVNLRNQAGDTALIVAIKEDKTEVALALLDASGIDDESKNIALKAAVAKRNFDIVQKLIEKGVKATELNGIDTTALQWVLMSAIEQGKTEVALALLGAPEIANLMLTKDKQNALLIAAFKGNVDVVRMLLTQGVDVNIKDQRGNTALYFAAQQGHLDIVEKLLLQDSIVVNNENIHKFTALMAAAENGHLAIVTKLLEKGADVNLQDNHGDTALHFAARKDHLDVVIKLLTKVDKVDTKNINGNTAIIDAIFSNHPGIALELIKQLPTASFSPPFLYNREILRAVEFDRLDVVKALLDKDKRLIHSIFSDGTTALGAAIKKGHSFVALELLTRGAIVNYTTEVDVLKQAVEKNIAEQVVEQVIKKAPPEIIQGQQGATALLSAVRQSKLFAVKALLAKGVNVTETKDSAGNTALMLAVQQNSLDIVIELIFHELKLAIQKKDFRRITQLLEMKQLKSKLASKDNFNSLSKEYKQILNLLLKYYNDNKNSITNEQQKLTLIDSLLKVALFSGGKDQKAFNQIKKDYVNLRTQMPDLTDANPLHQTITSFIDENTPIASANDGGNSSSLMKRLRNCASCCGGSDVVENVSRNPADAYSASPRDNITTANPGATNPTRATAAWREREQHQLKENCHIGGSPRGRGKQ